MRKPMAKGRAKGIGRDQRAGKRLARKRRLHGMTQQDLAERSSLYLNTVQEIERGRHRPNADEWGDLGKPFGMVAEEMRHYLYDDPRTKK
jgi:ribosome-binding protein aMBF1 (putative translation factor)